MKKRTIKRKRRAAQTRSRAGLDSSVPGHHKSAVNIRQLVKRGIKLFLKFREADPRYIDTVKIPSLPKVMLQIGRVDGVLYTTTHNGKVTKYIHKFSGRSKPILATDAKGNHLYFLGGRYNFTPEGIVDKRS